MKNIFLAVITLTIVGACKSDPTDPQIIVDEAISASGGVLYSALDLEFDFRDRHYRVYRNDGLFQYERHFEDSTGQVKDVVTNSDFKRFVNGIEVNVVDTMATKYYNSINSVQYFALLPYGLNDTAVNKSYLGEVSIKEETYHKIQVTFDQEGGGKDFEDVFIYWISADDFKVDYLAYSYLTDGGGMRFREAYNERIVKGLRVVDYNNYKPESNKAELNELDQLFEQNKLKLLSKIENTNVTVN